MPARRSPLLELHLDALGLIAAALPVKDRLSFAATCTQLHTASLHWFPTITISQFPANPEAAAELAAWLHARNCSTRIYEEGPENFPASTVGACLTALQRATLVELGASCDGSDFPTDCLEGHTQLTYLHLREIDSFSDAGATLWRLTRLEELSLQEIGRLPDFCGATCLARLKTLRLMDMDLALPQALSALHSLTALELVFYDVTGGWSCLAGLTQLQELLAGECELHQLPEAFSELMAVVSLHLDSCRVSGGWRNLARLPRLQRLLLGSLDELPEAVSQLTGLTALTWTGAHEQGWQYLQDLVNLQQLEMHIKWMKSFPASLAHLTALTSLVVEQYVPVQGGWQYLPASLKGLHILAPASLEAVPATVSRLTALAKLKLYANQLATGWHNLLMLPNLSVLLIPCCKAGREPEAVARLRLRGVEVYTA